MVCIHSCNHKCQTEISNRTLSIASYTMHTHISYRAANNKISSALLSKYIATSRSKRKTRSQPTQYPIRRLKYKKKTTLKPSSIPQSHIALFIYRPSSFASNIGLASFTALFIWQIREFEK